MNKKRGIEKEKNKKIRKQDKNVSLDKCPICGNQMPNSSISKHV